MKGRRLKDKRGEGKERMLKDKRKEGRRRGLKEQREIGNRTGPGKGEGAQSNKEDGGESKGDMGAKEWERL